MPKLIKTLVEAIEPEDKDVIVWDSEIRGFGICVRPSGKRVYLLKYRNKHGRQRKPTLGTHGSITCDQARMKARKWLGYISDGGDPSADQQTERKTLTIAHLSAKYLSDYAECHKRPSSIASDSLMLEKHILPKLRSLAINSLTRADVAKLHQSLRKTPYQANRTLALLSKMFNLAELWGFRPDGSNPCRHIKRYPEKKRERFLSTGELAYLGEALVEAYQTGITTPSVIAAIRLLIFTGCRLSEILTLRWDAVDFEGQCLALSESKTGAKIVHLGPPALELLSRMDRVEENPFVIVGQKPGTHLINLQKPWRQIRSLATFKLWAEDEQSGALVADLTKRLVRHLTITEIETEAKKIGLSLPHGLTDVRIHDLRHTFASIGASAGLSLLIIGKMLGHTQPQTTQRYAHLATDPVKQAAKKVSEQIAAAMAGTQAKVLPFS